MKNADAAGREATMWEEKEEEDRLVFNTSIANLGQRAEDLAMDIIRLWSWRRTSPSWSCLRADEL